MVGVTLRPDLDWSAIRAEWEAGATDGSLGRRYGCTRQAVSKRRRKEAWTRSPDAEALAQTVTGRRLERPATPQERRDAKAGGPGKRSMSAAQRLLDMLGCGATLALAARRLGMSVDAVRDWLAQDAELAAMVDAAQAEFAGAMVERIGDAAARDWRAAAHLLERHPASREEYQPAPQGPAGVGMIAVQVVLPPDLAAQLEAAQPAAPTIEHNPTEGDE